MADAHSIRHRQQKLATEADELELNAIIRGSQVFESGALDDKISGALQDIEDEAGVALDTLRSQRQDLGAEEISGGIAEEVARRCKIMGDAYPFLVTKSNLTYRSSGSKFYEFCLAASQSPSITKGEYVAFPRQFERASARLVELFMGPSAVSLHVGAPRDPVIGTTFKKGMETLAQRTGEFAWMPERDVAEEPTINGDEGVDFVVWRPMDDGRIGNLFILGQCACGGDWLQKWHDLDLAKLGKWFNPLSKIGPVRAFATPFHAVDGNLYEGTRQAGLFFDRARLALIAEKHKDDPKWVTWIQALQKTSELVLR